MRVQTAVIGAGVVGLACAAALSRRGDEVIVLERNPGPGRETSSRNSEVIHAGLYYARDSLKAVTCVEGRRRLYARCAELGIPHRKTGKLVVAARPEEVASLESIRERGLANGAGALELLDGRAVSRREPRVRACAALWSPESGIIDSHALLASYQAEAESKGAEVVLHTSVVGLELRDGAWRLATESANGERFEIEATWVINAAGLDSDHVAALAGIDVDGAGLRLHPCKGDYFAVAPALGALTRHLVYPVPVPGGLGVHVTLDLGGRYRLGPDVEYVERPRYDVDPAKAAGFAEAAARYLPEIREEHLTPEMAGVRPKLAAPGEEPRDFVIEEASHLGAPRLINLIGIESPGLTASPAIAERVVELSA